VDCPLVPVRRSPERTRQSSVSLVEYFEAAKGVEIGQLRVCGRARMRYRVAQAIERFGVVQTLTAQIHPGVQEQE
jgi:hypothetical protein